jgi:hypothetical protein
MQDLSLCSPDEMGGICSGFPDERTLLELSAPLAKQFSGSLSSGQDAGNLSCEDLMILLCCPLSQDLNVVILTPGD